MSSRRTPIALAVVVLFAAATLLALTCCTKRSDAETPTVEIHLDLKTPFHFVAYGDKKIALGNYFQRFPDLKNSRFYSVFAANTMTLVLDSSLDENTGAQGKWLLDNLDHVPENVDFVFVMDHHPPYTSSSDEKKFG